MHLCFQNKLFTHCVLVISQCISGYYYDTVQNINSSDVLGCVYVFGLLSGVSIRHSHVGTDVARANSFIHFTGSA